jgi:hypothetical protein
MPQGQSPLAAYARRPASATVSTTSVADRLADHFSVDRIVSFLTFFLYAS